MKKKLSLLLVLVMIISICSGCGIIASIDYSAGMNNDTATIHEEVYFTNDEYTYMQSGNTSTDMTYIGTKEYNGTIYHVYTAEAKGSEMETACCTEEFWAIDLSDAGFYSFAIVTVKFPKPVVSTNGTLLADGQTVEFNMLNISPNRAYAAFAATTPATIDGVEDGAVYKDTVSVTASGSVISFTVNGKAESENALSLTADGTYTLSVTGVDNVTTTKTITIDKTKPEVKGVKNNKTYKKAVTIKATDNISGISKCTLNGKSVKTSKLKKGYKVKKNGKYTLKITDKAGNTVKIKFKIKNK